MTGPQGAGVLKPHLPFGAEWEGTVVALGAESVSGGSSINTIVIPNVVIPPNCLIIVFASCGTNTAGTPTAACTDVTFATLVQRDNNAPNPDRRTVLIRGISGSTPGSTITVTFPAPTTERMACAIAIIGAPITNGGQDAYVAGTIADNPDNSFVFVQPAVDFHSQLGFVWIPDATGAKVVGSGAAETVIDYSPVSGSHYGLSVVKWSVGETNPTMTGVGGGGQGLLLELTGVVAPNLTLNASMGTLTAGGGTSQIIPLPAFTPGALGILVGVHGSTGSLNNDPAGWVQRLNMLDSSSRPKMRVWTRTLQAGDADPTITSTQVQLLAGRAYAFDGLASPLVIEDSGSKNLMNSGNDTVAPVNGCKLPTADPTSVGGLIFCVFCGFEGSNVRDIVGPIDGIDFTLLHQNEISGGGWTGWIAAGYIVPPVVRSYAPFNWLMGGSAPYPNRGAYMLCAAPA